MRQIELVSIDGITLDAAVHPSVGELACGTVVQAHGINTDMDEGGMFVRLADELARSGFDVLRFSFRGHGKSGGTQRGVTIAGELLDLQAAIDHAAHAYAGPLIVVAASFGAVSTCLSLPWLDARLNRLALWNPVLDLQKTFVYPELPWGRENFSPAQQALLRSQGYLLLDGEFEVGRVLFDELGRYAPLDAFEASIVPTLMIHGDQDSYVSYDIAHQVASYKPNCTFHTVAGSDHGFDSRGREDDAVNTTVDWIGSNVLEP